MRLQNPIYVLVFVVVLIGPLVIVAAEVNTPDCRSGGADVQTNEWQLVQQKLTKEYDVCLEHCGGKTSCENHCGKAHSTKMNREHTRLFGKPMTNTDKSGS